MSKILNTESKGDITIISTEGYFNKDLGEDLKNFTDQEIKKGGKHFLINLKESKIVISIGASILIEIIEELQTVDGTLSFCNLSPIIGKTFKIMGLTKYCTTYENEEEAVNAIG